MKSSVTHRIMAIGLSLLLVCFCLGLSACGNSSSGSLESLDGNEDAYLNDSQQKMRAEYLQFTIPHSQKIMKYQEGNLYVASDEAAEVSDFDFRSPHGRRVIVNLQNAPEMENYLCFGGKLKGKDALHMAPGGILDFYDSDNVAFDDNIRFYFLPGGKAYFSTNSSNPTQKYSIQPSEEFQKVFSLTPDNINSIFYEYKEVWNNYNLLDTYYEIPQKVQPGVLSRKGIRWGMSRDQLENKLGGDTLGLIYSYPDWTFTSATDEDPALYLYEGRRQIFGIAKILFIFPRDRYGNETGLSGIRFDIEVPEIGQLSGGACYE